MYFITLFSLFFGLGNIWWYGLSIFPLTVTIYFYKETKMEIFLIIHFINLFNLFLFFMLHYCSYLIYSDSTDAEVKLGGGVMIINIIKHAITNL